MLESDWSHGLSAGSGGSSLATMFSVKHLLRDGFLQDKSGPSASDLALPAAGHRQRLERHRRQRL